MTAWRDSGECRGRLAHTMPWRTGYVKEDVAALLKASSPMLKSRSLSSPDLPRPGCSGVATTVGITKLGCKERNCVKKTAVEALHDNVEWMQAGQIPRYFQRIPFLCSPYRSP